MSVLTIDGSRGEGGGQVLRTALGLSLVTGTPFRIEAIRAGRSRPGLLAQHLAAVRAAMEVGAADVEGYAAGSRELVFRPRSIRSGEHRFSIGTAGSTTLVFQTVLPALLRADGPSSLSLEGGTHNAWAPPFDFLERVFLPLLFRMGVSVEVTLKRPGFHPAGGGLWRARVEPAGELEPLELLDRGRVRSIEARALVSALARSIGEREVRQVTRALGGRPVGTRVEEVRRPRGPGNALLLTVRCDEVTELFSGFGRRGVPAEKVADAVAREAREWIDAGVPVGPWLADQLIVPLALAGGGTFRTLPPSAHTLTNIEVMRAFLDVPIEVAEEGPRAARITVG